MGGRQRGERGEYKCAGVRASRTAGEMLSAGEQVSDARGGWQGTPDAVEAAQAWCAGDKAYSSKVGQYAVWTDVWPALRPTSSLPPLYRVLRGGA